MLKRLALAAAIVAATSTIALAASGLITPMGSLGLVHIDAPASSSASTHDSHPDRGPHPISAINPPLTAPASTPRTPFQAWLYRTFVASQAAHH